MNLLDLARSALPNTSEAVPLPAGAPKRPANNPVASAPRAPDPATEARRLRVLSILAQHPEVRYAVVTDDRSDPDTTTLHIGIRGVATGDIVIAKACYDGAEVLKMLARLEDNQLVALDSKESSPKATSTSGAS